MYSSVFGIHLYEVLVVFRKAPHAFFFLASMLVGALLKVYAFRVILVAQIAASLTLSYFLPALWMSGETGRSWESPAMVSPNKSPLLSMYKTTQAGMPPSYSKVVEWEIGLQLHAPRWRRMVPQMQQLLRLFVLDSCKCKLSLWLSAIPVLSLLSEDYVFLAAHWKRTTWFLRCVTFYSPWFRVEPFRKFSDIDAGRLLQEEAEGKASSAAR